LIISDDWLGWKYLVSAGKIDQTMSPSSSPLL